MITPFIQNSRFVIPVDFAQYAVETERFKKVIIHSESFLLTDLRELYYNQTLLDFCNNFLENKKLPGSHKTFGEVTQFIPFYDKEVFKKQRLELSPVTQKIAKRIIQQLINLKNDGAFV